MVGYPFLAHIALSSLETKSCTHIIRRKENSFLLQRAAPSVNTPFAVPCNVHGGVCSQDKLANVKQSSVDPTTHVARVRSVEHSSSDSVEGSRDRGKRRSQPPKFGNMTRSKTFRVVNLPPWGSGLTCAYPARIGRQRRRGVWCMFSIVFVANQKVPTVHE